MSRLFWLCLLLLLLQTGGRAAAQQIEPPQADPASSCRPPPDSELLIAADQQRDWSPCEKWIWSCLSNELEANMFQRQCVEPRSARAKEWREAARLEPFRSPDRYSSNAVRHQFIADLLSKDSDYSKYISVFGVRIVGAYFADTLNLENVDTERNLVLDQSIFKQGIRLTTFQSSKNVSFDGSNVRGKSMLNRSDIKGSVFMVKGVYDIVDLREAKIGSSFEGRDSVFAGQLFLDRAHIDGKIELVRAFLTDVTGRGTTTGLLWLSGADVRGRLDFTGALIGGDVRLKMVRFGRALSSGPVSCDWDLNRWKLLADVAGKQIDLNAELRQEVIDSRPEFESAADPAGVCPNPLENRPTKLLHEVLLRDMVIKGTLCILDVTGEREGEAASSIKSISLNGTDARSTVIRWAPEKPPVLGQPTLWSIVLFKTSHLLLDLGGQPSNYFIDNLEFATISFMNTRKNGLELTTENDDDEDTGASLCDARPDPSTYVDAASRHQHILILKFFLKNKADSIQPFAKMVERLDQVGASSTYLHLHLNYYRYGKVCATSVLFRNWRIERLGLSQSMLADPPVGFIHWVSELKDVALDAGCLATSYVYSNTIGYGLAFVPTQIVLYLGLAGFVFFGFRSYRRAILVAAERNVIVDGADIFISYAKHDRSLAEELATSLRREGYSVWWDTSILTGENYRDTILRELAGAKAVIVIWTERSVKSEWVISEAQRALAQGKLLPVREAGLDENAIPPPFEIRQTADLGNLAAILAAVKERKVQKSLVPSEGQSTRWLWD